MFQPGYDAGFAAREKSKTAPAASGNVREAGIEPVNERLSKTEFPGPSHC